MVLYIVTIMMVVVAVVDATTQIRAVITDQWILKYLAVNYDSDILVLIHAAFTNTSASITDSNHRDPFNFIIPRNDVFYQLTWGEKKLSNERYYRTLNVANISGAYYLWTPSLLHVRSVHPVSWVIHTPSLPCAPPTTAPPPSHPTTTHTSADNPVPSSTCTPPPTSAEADDTSPLVVALAVVCGVLALTTTLSLAACIYNTSRSLRADQTKEPIATTPPLSVTAATGLPPSRDPPPVPGSSPPVPRPTSSLGPAQREHYHYDASQQSLKRDSQHDSENSLYEAFG